MGKLLTPEVRYDLLRSHLSYTSDPDAYQELCYDLKAMAAIWRHVEFSDELAYIPVYATDDSVGYNRDSLGFYVPSADNPTGDYIIVNVVNCVHDAFFTRQTLYKTVAEVVLHEMCHAFDYRRGVADCDADGTHTTVFRDTARAHGLTCRKVENGWGRTRIRPGHMREFMNIANGIMSWSPLFGHSEWMPTLAEKMRNTHVDDDIAWAFMSL